MIYIKATKEALLKPLQLVSNVVERRHTLPILSNILIRKRGATVEFIATDIEMQITARVEIGHGAEEGATTVSAKKLLDILRALNSDGEVTISQAANKLVITQGKSRFNLQTLAAEEFPVVVPAADYAAQTKIAQSKLKACLHLVHFSMAQQDIRYYLNGMLLVLHQGQLRTVATDGHRLAYSSQEVENDAQLDVIIPRKVVSELQKVLEDVDQPLSISVNPNQVKFSFDQVEIISKLIEGKFPDYDRVIPKNHQKTLKIDREKLNQALIRVAILTTDKFKGVRLAFSTSQVKISSTNAEQEEAVEELDIDYGFEPMEIGFNVQYLLDVLSYLEDQTVTLQLQDNNASALLMSETHPSFRYVVMPMRI